MACSSIPPQWPTLSSVFQTFNALFVFVGEGGQFVDVAGLLLDQDSPGNQGLYSLFCVTSRNISLHSVASGIGFHFQCLLKTKGELGSFGNFIIPRGFRGR
jgi:hypothetical protein